MNAHVTTVAARFDPELRAELEQLARRHERTLSQEIRLAARLHVARHRGEAQTTPERNPR